MKGVIASRCDAPSSICRTRLRRSMSGKRRFSARRVALLARGNDLRLRRRSGRRDVAADHRGRIGRTDFSRAGQRSAAFRPRGRVRRDERVAVSAARLDHVSWARSLRSRRRGAGERIAHRRARAARRRSRAARLHARRIIRIDRFGNCITDLVPPADAVRGRSWAISASTISARRTPATAHSSSSVPPVASRSPSPTAARRRSCTFAAAIAWRSFPMTADYIQSREVRRRAAACGGSSCRCSSRW